MLSTDQIIEQIQHINRSADRDWLAKFDDASLRRYLDHLQKTIEPRGGESFWLRPGDSPAIVTRKKAA